MIVLPRLYRPSDTWLSSKHVTPAKTPTMHLPEKCFFPPWNRYLIYTQFTKARLSRTGLRDKMVSLLASECRGNKTQKDSSASRSHSSAQQYNHTDPIQQHFSSGFCSLHVFRVCVCLFPFSNHPPPLTVPPLRSLVFLCVLKFLFICVFSSVSINCSSGPRISPTIVCTFVTAHITLQGLVFVLAERGSSFLI